MLHHSLPAGEVASASWLKPRLLLASLQSCMGEQPICRRTSCSYPVHGQLAALLCLLNHTTTKKHSDPELFPACLHVPSCSCSW